MTSDTVRQKAYKIRLVCERGIDPVTGEVHERAEEVVEVEAESLWKAYRRATAKMSINPMGRLLEGFDADTGEEAAPPEAGPHRRAIFEIADVQGPYDGYTNGETWNGWATPVFEHSVALRIAEDYERVSVEMGGDMAGAYAHYDEVEDAFVFYEPVNEDEAYFYPQTIVFDGREVRVYPIGTYEWTWEDAQA